MSISDSSENLNETQQVDSLEIGKFQELRINIEKCNINRFYCTVENCKASFAQKGYLEKHRRYKHGWPIKCFYKNCNTYIKASSLKRHVDLVHKKSSRQCEHCGELVQDLKIHIEACKFNENKNYRCAVGGCKASYSKKKNLIQHEKDVHGPVSVKCPNENCDKYIKPIYLKKHIEVVHEGKKEHFCSKDGCTMAFARKQALDRHEKFGHDNHKHKCDKCGLSVTDLERHLKFCTSEKKFYCTTENCESSFATQSNLNSHLRRVHKDRMRCPREGCDSYVKPQSLATHFRLVHEHKKKARRLCVNCGQRFANLWVHQRICTSDGNKKFRCSVGNCAASFIDESYLHKHISRTHVAAVKCPKDDCNVYIKKTNVDSHLKYVHGNIEEKCDNCGKLLKHLIAHRKICIGGQIKKFPCDFEDCEASFTRKGNLSKHKVKHMQVPA